MSKILIVTVGGSPQPILTAIADYTPDRVLFICSGGSSSSAKQVTGEGKPCTFRFGDGTSEQRPNLITLAGLTDFDESRDLLILEDPDDLAAVYQSIAQSVQDLKKEDGLNRIIADYTGGTKTMSAALVLAATDYDLELSITSSANRSDLIRITTGESSHLSRTASLQIERYCSQILPDLLNSHNYSAILTEVRRIFSQQQLDACDRQRLQRLQALCRGLDAWDCFDHRAAWQALSPYIREPQLQPLVLFLKRVMGSRSQLDSDYDSATGTKGNGYEIVEDLILNAERRAQQQRYDDAVGRLYRALELTAQLRLKLAYQIDTGNVDLGKLPEDIRTEYIERRDRSPKNILQLASTESYRLLKKLPSDPLGQLFAEREQVLLDQLQIRNNSLFAHGFQAIGQSQYQQLKASFVDFIQTAIAQLSPKPSQPSSVAFPCDPQIFLVKPE